jgi:hypothetical protein
MSDASLDKGDMTDGFESDRKCIIQRCDTYAEYQCVTCLKRYCDKHFRIHGHFDNSDDLR